MDDIIQIVAVLIFIYSIFSSAKKKKKTEEQKNKPVPKPESYSGSGRAVSKIPKNDDYDILQEIEDMFQTPKAKKIEPPVTYQYNRPSDESLRNENEYTIYSNKRSSSETGRNEGETSFSKNYRTASEVSSTDSEHTIKEYYISSNDLSNRTSNRRSIYLNYDDYKPGEQSSKTNKRIAELKDKEKLKNYLIYSEILGKPKAFS